MYFVIGIRKRRRQVIENEINKRHIISGPQLQEPSKSHHEEQNQNGVEEADSVYSGGQRAFEWNIKKLLM